MQRGNRQACLSTCMQSGCAGGSARQSPTSVGVSGRTTPPSCGIRPYSINFCVVCCVAGLHKRVYVSHAGHTGLCAIHATSRARRPILEEYSGGYYAHYFRSRVTNLVIVIRRKYCFMSSNYKVVNLIIHIVCCVAILLLYVT